jgi:phenylalanyl-tRNA synthetase alpha chain
LREELESIRVQCLNGISSVTTHDDLEKLRVKYLGKKGLLTKVLRGMGGVSPEERPILGSTANEIRDELEEAIKTRYSYIKEKEKAQRFETEAIDVTMPGRRRSYGKRHPLTLVIDEIKEVFVGLGYQVVEGPEIELDYYNFEALNVPPDHPARDLQDTFYITDEFLLRTQTSPVQIRVMESQLSPVKIIAPGKVYRCDADVTHSPMFHQIEGLAIGEDITFGDLKGTLTIFSQRLFGKDRGVRFRPHYFPFTEPSAEVDISCIICNGKGCRLCSNTGWIEILGAGMVDPQVLKVVNYDSNKVGGFAFGMGVERIAMLKYGIDDIRLFFENDLRFLEQF